MLRKCTQGLLTAACLFLLAGCNTVEGFGKDLSKLGDKIEQKAEQVKK
jgi:predicted small secreted protein